MVKFDQSNEGGAVSVKTTLKLSIAALPVWQTFRPALSQVSIQLAVELARQKIFHKISQRLFYCKDSIYSPSPH
jgi:hypothetical protein